LERWEEYQTELAKVLLYGYGPDAYKDALCEWDILGRSGQEVYVFAICVTTPPFEEGGSRQPAVIYLEADESIQNVRVPGYKGPYYDLKLFPVDVQEKLELYYFTVCVYCGRPEELRIHLLYRQTHSDEPPLNVLSATPIPTPTP